jgi:aquaporin Z
MRRYITEFIGTFFLVMVIGLAVRGGAGNMAPVAIGAVLMTMIYAGAHVSGAHYNPAVSFAILIRKRVAVTEALIFVVFQVAAAIVAGLVVNYFLGDAAAAPQPNADAVKALLAEVTGTFALVYVILNVATASANTGNNYYGLAIGFTVASMAYALGPFSGGAFNPAVAVGICILQLADWKDIWIYMIGCFGGGIIAGVIFRFLSPNDR